MFEPFIQPFQVFVRIRPQIKEKESISLLSKVDDQTLSFPQSTFKYIGSKEERQMQFNHVFSDEEKTHQVYQNTLSPILINIVNGFNVTVLCYGMTGAGKTFTMFGDQLNPGLIFQGVQELFRQNFYNTGQYKYGMKLSFLEIYNETVRDLLNLNENLVILEDSNGNTLIPGLHKEQIKNENELMTLLYQGQQRRTFASTVSNQVSSRSHAIVQIEIEKYDPETNECWIGKLMMVDLAGSERMPSYSLLQSSLKRQQEGQNINRSLLSLGQCITALLQPGNKFIPYRNSKLTRLLKQSLGGNSYTLFIACVSKSSHQMEETENTLRYALQAKDLTCFLKSEKIIDKRQSFIENEDDQIKLIIDQYSQCMKSQGENYNQEIQKQLETLSELCEEKQSLQNSLKELEQLNNKNQKRLKHKNDNELEQLLRQNMIIEKQLMQSLQENNRKQQLIKDFIGNYFFDNSQKLQNQLKMFSEFLNVVQQEKKSFLEDEVKNLKKEVEKKNNIIYEMRKSCVKKRVSSIKCLKNNNSSFFDNKMRFSQKNYNKENINTFDKSDTKSQTAEISVLSINDENISQQKTKLEQIPFEKKPKFKKVNLIDWKGNKKDVIKQITFGQQIDLAYDQLGQVKNKQQCLNLILIYLQTKPNISQESKQKLKKFLQYYPQMSNIFRTNSLDCFD